MMLQTPLRPNSKLKMEEYFLHWVHEANNRIAVRRFFFFAESFLKNHRIDDSSRFLRLIFFKNALNISTTSHISSLLLLFFLSVMQISNAFLREEEEAANATSSSSSIPFGSPVRNKSNTNLAPAEVADEE